MWAGSKVVGTSLNKFLAKSRLCFPSVFTISAHYCLGVWYRPSPNSMQGATYLQNYAEEYCQMLKWNLLLKEINGCCHRHRYVKAYREFKQRRFFETRVNRKWVFFSFNLPWRDVRRSKVEGLRFRFTPNGRREFVPRYQVFPLFSVYSLLLLHKNK